MFVITVVAIAVVVITVVAIAVVVIAVVAIAVVVIAVVVITVVAIAVVVIAVVAIAVVVYRQVQHSGVARFSANTGQRFTRPPGAMDNACTLITAYSYDRVQHQRSDFDSPATDSCTTCRVETREKYGH